MKYSLLGRSGLQVSEIGFGCMSLQQDEPSGISILHAALDRGINFFDTADLYDKGANEVLVGKALKGRRGQVILASKAGNQWRKDGSGWDWNPRKEYILSCVEESLKRLNTSYLDLYQLHGGTINDNIDESIEAFEILKQQGKIRHYGISSIRPNVIREYVKRSSIVSVMMQYSLLDRRPEETCLSLLLQEQIGVLSRGALAQGLLVNKPAKDYLGHSKEEVRAAAEAVQSISGSKRSASATAIRYVLQQPGITSAVIGIRTMQQLEEAVAAAEAAALSGKEMKLLGDRSAATLYSDHR